MGDQKEMTSKAFIVLGMGRSATSLMGKGLYSAGVDIGDKLVGKKRGNEKGHWEDLEIVQLNDKILSAAGGAWNNPPEEDMILENGQLFKKDIKRLMLERKKKDLWGFKDPRTTLTIKLFLPYLKDVDVHFFCCFRKPRKVAESLKVRDGAKISNSMKLAKIYNDRLLSFMAWWLNEY